VTGSLSPFMAGSWTPSRMCESRILPMRFRRASSVGSNRPPWPGGSDKPHDPAAYAMEVRVGEAVGVLDELAIEGAHFIGMSWGGRLGFGIGEHAPERVLSLVSGGQRPYEWPDSPLTRAVSMGCGGSNQGRRSRGRSAGGVLEHPLSR